MTTHHTQDTLPIREIARITGVNPVTLRAWERRYGLIQPQRTAKGHRLYSQADIETIQHIVAWLNQGIAIRHIAELLKTATPPSQPQPDAWQDWHQQLQQALQQQHSGKLKHVFKQLLSTYPLPLAYQQVLQPWIRQVQLHAQHSPTQQLHGHLFQHSLRSLLLGLIDSDQRPSGPLLLSIHQQDPSSELCSLLFTLHAQNAGYHCHYQGALPLECLPLTLTQHDYAAISWWSETPATPAQWQSWQKYQQQLTPHLLLIGDSLDCQAPDATLAIQPSQLDSALNHLDQQQLKESS